MQDWVKPVQFLLTIGWYVALSLIIPVGIGYWLDRPGMFNTHPLFIFIGLGLGTVFAFSGLIMMLRRFQKEQEEQDRKKTKKE